MVNGRPVRIPRTYQERNHLQSKAFRITQAAESCYAHSQGLGYAILIAALAHLTRVIEFSVPVYAAGAALLIPAIALYSMSRILFWRARLCMTAVNIYDQHTDSQEAKTVPRRKW